MEKPNAQNSEFAKFSRVKLSSKEIDNIHRQLNGSHQKDYDSAIFAKAAQPDIRHQGHENTPPPNSSRGHDDHPVQQELDGFIIIDRIQTLNKPPPREDQINRGWTVLRESMRLSRRSRARASETSSGHMRSIIRNTRLFNHIDELEKLLKSSRKFKEAQRAAAKGHFRDAHFPANLDSLVGFVEGPKADPMAELVWLRPKDFYLTFVENGKRWFTKKTTENYTVFDRVRPDVIAQGRLGDCYFLAACSAIAIYPQRLERLFISGRTYNPEGLYAVAVCVNGIWEEILVDDYFPCVAESRQPAFSHGTDRSLWVMLLEKAWAKVHLGYLNISSGFISEALRDLTGAPTESYFFEKQEIFDDTSLSAKNARNWEQLKAGFRQKFVMCASSRNFNQDSDAVDRELGISGNHAYSVLGVFEVGRGRSPNNSRRRAQTGQNAQSLGQGRLDGALGSRRSTMDSCN